MAGMRRWVATVTQRDGRQFSVTISGPTVDVAEAGYLAEHPDAKTCLARIELFEWDAKGAVGR